MITAREILRWVCGFLAFNVYSLFLLSAFQENTPYLFDAKLVSAMRAAGKLRDLKDWGWDDHYIWRLFSGVVVTLIAGFLAGAIAKSRGALLAAVSNVPSVAVWAVMVYFAAFGETEIAGQTGFIVVSLIAIPLTTFLAYVAGQVGEEFQKGEFSDNTVLGIWPYHWIWAALPLYWYSLGVVFVFTKFIVFQLMTWRDSNIFGAIASLLVLIPLIAWVYPLIFIHQVLSGETYPERSAAFKFLVNTGVFIAGGFLATGIQIACYWLLAKML